MRLSSLFSRTGRAEETKVIVSFYMDNIPEDLVDLRDRALKILIGSDVQIMTVKTALSHSEAIDDFLARELFDTVLILDFDCLPLTRDAVDRILRHAGEGLLVGAAQRANHIENGGHVYVGPFCMAFSRVLYESLGRPSFRETDRGDVGAEMTYAAQEKGERILMMWPTSVEEPKWSLTNYVKFGLGTTYSQDFWHAFTLHTPRGQDTFRSMCRSLIERAA